MIMIFTFYMCDKQFLSTFLGIVNVNVYIYAETKVEIDNLNTVQSATHIFQFLLKFVT